MAEIPTDYFPGQALADPFVMQAGAMNDPETDQEDSVAIQTSVGGQEQRRIYWAQDGRRHYVFDTMPLTQDQAQLVRDFIRTHRGQGNPFWFFWFEQEKFLLENVGTANGGTTLDLPFRNLVTTAGGSTPGPSAVYDNGGAITFAYSALGTGGGEAHLSSLQGPPTAGHAITATFYGNIRKPCRIESARPRKVFFNKGITRVPHPIYSFQLIEVL